MSRLLCAAIFCVFSLFSQLTLGAAGPVITEFLTQNSGGLRDADGDSPDWVEIFNQSPSAVNLGGWYLTDDTNDLTQWAFPVTTLNSAGYLMVFASGKDRAVAGQELHANFALSAGGGFLALVEPDGQTVASFFEYPDQRVNVSYGIGLEVSMTNVLIGANAPTRVLVPADGSLGNSWKASGFDDSSWLATNAPVGFEVGALANVVLAVDFNERGGALTQSGFDTFEINSVGGATAIQVGGTTRNFGSLSVTVAGAGSDLGYDDRVRGTPTDGGAFTESALLRDFVFSRVGTGSGGLDVTVNGLVPNKTYRFVVWSFDSGSAGNRVSDWVANGVVVANNYSFGGQNLPTANEQYQFTFDLAADATGRLLLSGRRDSTSMDSNGADSFGVFINALQISDLTAVPVTEGLASLMLSNNATAYLRVPFNVADPALISSLTLNMQYDDGFDAYLNGQPVADANTPDGLTWNGMAIGPHEGSVVEGFGIIPPPGLLVAGQNMLAIQGLNINADDLDFLINPELFSSENLALADRFFSPPTPGADNGNGFDGLVRDTKFSVDRGFFETPFSLSITSATAGASIYWTDDGTVPSPSNGNLYTGPVSIVGTTYIKAVAYRVGWVPTDVDTHTYIFLDEVLQQPATMPGFPTIWQGNYPADYAMDPEVVNSPNYGVTIKDDLRSLPTLSLTMPHPDLWGGSGIYNNATSEGVSWERACSAELFNGDGTTEFSVNCGVQMQGNASRDNARTPKHAFRLLFKSIYGPGRLNYGWFPGAVERFNTVVLRACFTDSWSTRYSDSNFIPGGRGRRYRPEDSLILRDVWVKDTLRDMGGLSGRSDFVHLYINGLYWGVYNPSDRLDETFFAEHLGGREEDWDVIRDFSEVLAGSKSEWNQMMNLVNAGVTTEPAFQAVSELVDVENLIDFMLLHIYAEAEDWPHHNWYAARRRATAELPATRWQFLSWDQEIVLDRLVRRNRINVSNNDTPARIYSQLRAYPEFRRMFGDRIQKHFFNNGALTESNNFARLEKRVNRMARGMVGESARWGDARESAIGANPATGQTFTLDEWFLPEVEKLRTEMFPTLNDINLARFRSGGLYPDIDAPEFNQHGGHLTAGFELVMTHPAQPSGTIFYTLDGTDPREYGTAAVAPSARAYSEVITFNTTTRVQARVLMNSVWSALITADFFPPQDLDSLVLNEIMYNPPDFNAIPGADLEFIELKNTGSEMLDLTGMHFSDGFTFAFTNGTRLGPGELFLLGRNEAALTNRYPGLVVNGLFTGQLDNGGETVALRHPVGTRIFSVNYNDAGRWPVTADGFGYSLVPRDPLSHPNSGRPVNWRASTWLGGSPGMDDPAPVVSELVINEILTHTDLPQVDSVEVHNPTGQDVDLGGWYLTDDRKVPQKFRTPPGTIIPAGGYHVFTESDFNPTPGVGLSFNLSSVGEEIYLVSGDGVGDLTGYSDGFNFGASANGVSFGRYLTSVGDEHYPAQVAVTLNGANAGPVVGPVVISQIMYHPPDLANGLDNRLAEFIELTNITGEQVPLFNAIGAPWMLRDAVSFTFPAGMTMAASGRLLVLPFDPADSVARNAFLSTYPMMAGMPMAGPYTGKLDNSNERIELVRPDLPNPDGVPEILVERVHYEDSAPWPVGADGTGAALHRVSLTGYGNDPTNWVARADLSITIPPQGGDVVPGENLSLSVLAVGTGTLGYQWHKDGAPIPGATLSSLTINNAEEEDQGFYRVQVSDATGTISSPPVFVGVLIPPYFIVPPLSQSVVERSDVTLYVQSGGHLPMGYRWRFGSFTIGHEYIFSHTASHTIPNVDMTNAGIYSVVLTNASLVVPGVLSPRATLTVLADSDGDGLPDDYETEHGLNPLDPADADLDLDGDGQTARQEYQAGTDPDDPNSVLRLEGIRVEGDQVTLQFMAVSNRAYRVLYKDSLADATWTGLRDVLPHATNRVVEFEDAEGLGIRRFYQLITPATGGN